MHSWPLVMELVDELDRAPTGASLTLAFCPYVYPSCCTTILPVGYARMFLLADGATISPNARNNAARSNDLFLDIPFNIEQLLTD